MKTTVVNNYDYSIGLYRVLAILLIVAHHSMCLWFDNNIHTYSFHFDSSSQMIAFLSGCFKTVGLGAFMVISGNLFFRKRYRLNQVFTFIINKSMRLLVPYFFWLIAYALWSYYPLEEILTLPIRIFSCTHLWFLPTLFVIMLVCFFINVLDNKYIFVAIFIASVILYLLRVPGPQPVYKYLSLFLTGGWVYRISMKCPTFLNNKALLLIVFIISIVGFILTHIGYKSICIYSFWHLSLVLLVFLLCRLNFLEKITKSLFVMTVSKDSFGIYLIHQFIIFFLIKNVNINDIFCGEVAIFIVFVLSLIISILVTRALRLTSYTALLIGESKKNV